MSVRLKAALKALAEGHNLPASVAEDVILEILAGEGSPLAIAALLTALRMKGETAEELTGAVRAVRARMASDGFESAPPGVIDTCGTGGDGSNTVNVSTAAAIVVAACGVPVAKHGNRSASGNSGSAEVLAELGVAIDLPAKAASRCLRELGITFLFAPKYHPGMKTVAGIRRELPFRTLFNLIGPLANPSSPDFQLVGVSGEREALLMANALASLGIKHAAVVVGSDGLDEVTLSGPTRVLDVKDGGVTEGHWLPSEFGLGPVQKDELRVSGPADSAARIGHLLAGEPGPVRETVLANAAAALWVAGEADLAQGVKRGSDAIDSGKAAGLLASWRTMSHEAE